MYKDLLRRVLMLVAGSLVGVGCGQGTSPTMPTAFSAGPVSTGLSASTNRFVAQSASSVTTVVSIPVGFTIQPAAKAAIQACVGETVTFAGDARFVAHQTTLPDGSVVLDRLHLNPQGAVAIGSSTGLRYRLVGADNNPIVLAPSGTLTATFSANLLVIGPGSSGNFTAHILQHITITPTGTITALVDVFGIECR